MLLEALPIEDRQDRWQQVPNGEKATVLVGMRAQAREPIIASLSPEQVDLLLQQLDAESLIELSINLSDELIDRAYHHLNEKQKVWYKDSSQFEVDQIGRFTDHNIVARPQNTTVKEALRAVKRSSLSEVHQVYVLDKDGKFIGIVRISSILKATDENQLIKTLIESDFIPVIATQKLVEAADCIERSDLSAYPVIDENQHLIGKITLHTALWIQREAYESRLMAGAGLSESADLFVPVAKGARQRAVWLGLNLLTAFLASWTIGLFENVLSQVVALAVLMPVVASMGGIAGSQTLTLIIRGLATKQVGFGNSFALSKQELGIAVFNGIGWAIVIGLVAFVWFGNGIIGLVIGIAVMTNIIVAAISGVYIPLILDKFNFDPALSGAVVLTTVTDVVGFVTFLGLGTLLIL